MAKDFAKKFYNSRAWRKCRDAYMKYQQGLCERCAEPGKIVHHKTYINETNIHDTNITLNFNNLEYLCQDCHNKEHFEKYGITSYELMFDDTGNLVPKC